MSPIFYVMCLVLIVVDTAIHVMIQMYFEGHRAFDDKYNEFEEEELLRWDGS